ncbi:MAG: hypothetical protein WDA75_20675 [Candidatus Latescibacterota bacterium]|jgi:hypothetical protein
MADHLTLKLEGRRITAKCFQAAYKAFVDMAAEVARSVAAAGDRDQPIDWLVSVDSGSIVLHLNPDPEQLSPEEGEQVITVVQDGVRALRLGTPPPVHFTPRAGERLRALASMVTESNGDLSAVRFGRNGAQEEVTVAAGAVAPATRRGYVDLGTIEGKMAVLWSGSQPRFSIVDNVTKRKIPCYFEPSLWDVVKAAFDLDLNHHVAASGRIAYSANGSPEKIHMERFRVLGGRGPRPSVVDMVGILK